MTSPLSGVFRTLRVCSAIPSSSSAIKHGTERLAVTKPTTRCKLAGLLCLFTRCPHEALLLLLQSLVVDGMEQEDFVQHNLAGNWEDPKYHSQLMKKGS